ncbi:MAG: FtsX-like permease family protein [Pacificimonas sp.]
MIPESLQPRAERFRFLPPEKAAAGALPWIIALMVLLAVLGLAAGLALASGVGVMNEGLSRSFTVQIVEANPDLMAGRVSEAEAILSRTDGISDIERLTEAELRGLLEPWLGTGNVGEDLPLPAMIDAEASEAVDLEALSARLSAEIEGARLDDHAGWLAPVSRVAWALASVALIAALLVAVATSAIVVLGVRAGLGRHRETIDVLHLMGAEDRHISALFQYRFAMIACLGAAIGFGAGLIVLVVVGGLIGTIGGGLAGAAGLPWWGWIAVVAAPFGAVLLAMSTARITVERSLKDAL